MKCPDLSERVCRPCGRKIRNAVENFSFIKPNLAYPDLQSVADSSRSSPPRQKRLLPTTVTPERSSTKIKKAKVRRKLQGTSSKQLFKEQNAKGEINNLLNCDTSPTDTIETDTSDTFYRSLFKQYVFHQPQYNTGACIVPTHGFSAHLETRPS